MSAEDDFERVVFGKLLHWLRQEKGEKQAEFAEGMGVSQGYLSRIEKGDVMPDMPVMRRIADHCGMTRLELMNTFEASLQATLEQSGFGDHEPAHQASAQRNAWDKWAVAGIGALAAAAVLVYLKSKSKK